MTSAASDPRLVVSIDVARQRLQLVAMTLGALRALASVLATTARWDSDAGRAFHRDADALTADIGALVEGVERLRDDLLATRAQATRHRTSALP